MRPSAAVRSAGQAAGFGGHPLKLLKWSPYRNPAGTMIAFFSIELPSGMVLRDLRLMLSAKGNRSFVAMPAIRSEGDDGQVKWTDVVDFRSREVRDRFQAPILGLLRREHPEAFE